MKQIVSEIESNWCFQNNVKTCLQNKKLIFPVKMVELPQLHANTSIVGEFLELSLKTFPCTKTGLVLCENQSFLTPNSNWKGPMK